MRLAALVTLGGCYYASAPSSEGTAPDGGGVASSEFPCEVAETLQYCWGCHAEPPRGGAPHALTQRAHLAASSAVGGATIATRAVTRMRDAERPMPPSGLPRPSAAQVDAFAAWVDAGMPAGSCEGGAMPPDAGVAMTTCTSGSFWPAQWEDGHPDMNPGLPCRACHLTEEPSKAFFFMGTAYPSLHEKDRCYSSVPSGTRVDIIDANGVVALTMQVRARGNFFSTDRDAEIALPFTARIVTADGRVNQMMTPQMTGDCNGCHTEQGANGAPGRILIP